MDIETKEYLLELVTTQENLVANVLLLNPTDIKSVKVTNAVHGSANTNALVTLQNDTNRAFNYNRQSFANAVNAVVGYDGFAIEEFTSENVASYLTTKGLAISAIELTVIKLGDSCAKLECNENSIRYYGSINVVMGEGNVVTDPLLLEIDIPASVSEIPALNALNEPNLTWLRTVDHDAKTITLIASGDISPAAEATFIPMYIGTSEFANTINQLKVTHPTQIVAKFTVGQNHVEFTSQQLIDQMQYDIALNRYYSQETIKSIYPPLIELSLDNFVTKTGYTLIVDISGLT